MKLLIINGPNINFLGIREPAIYGSTTYKDLCGMLETWCADAGASCELFQSNHEGAIVDRIQQAWFDGVDRDRDESRRLHAHERRHSRRPESDGHSDG